MLEAWYPGQEDGPAIGAILFGSADPSGHLPVTFPTSLSQVPASTAAQWPGQNGTVQYSEGIDVGYRWYDSQGLTPLFPFGYGLSYTSFSFSNLKIGSLVAGGAATVSATVTNTGSRAGADVAQLYVTDPSASGEPPRQLEGFARVSLAAGREPDRQLPGYPAQPVVLEFQHATPGRSAPAATRSRSATRTRTCRCPARCRSARPSSASR